VVKRLSVKATVADVVVPQHLQDGKHSLHLDDIAVSRKVSDSIISKVFPEG